MNLFLPSNLWKRQHWQNISSSSAVLHWPQLLLLPTSPTQPSWFARSMPRTVSHTQGRHTQTTSPPAHPHIPAGGTCMCPSLVPQHMILFSYSDLLQMYHKLSVIWMLFSKVLHFITYFFLPLLWYSIMLLFFSYENMTTKCPRRDHIKLLALLHHTKHLFPSDLFKQKKTEFHICNGKYQHMMCHSLYLMWP
jgi:hypothetical protein